ncbi:MAG: hypothetical protein ACYDBQ_05360 [Thermoplasmatota archaeon]
MHEPNPMRDVLHRQLGVDAFCLDGDAAILDETWQDEPRATLRAKEILAAA